MNPDDIQDNMELMVLEVLDLIDGQGHSGFSHGYFCNLLIPLLKDMPITPLTGRDWEWNNRYCRSEKRTWQNSRCSRVFKEGDRAYNYQGRAFSNDGEVWYTSMNSRKEITFPCSMKDLETEYVRLEEKENGN